MTIISLPLFQVGQLSVTVERMGAYYRLTPQEACLETDQLDMTLIVLNGPKTSEHTNNEN